MIIDCISDLHGYCPPLPGGDLLLITGDLTARDTVEGYQAFMEWLKKAPYTHKVVIAGNHDGLVEKRTVSLSAPEQNIHYLEDSQIVVDGLKIWGSPYTPEFMSWHFMCSRGMDIKKHWQLIPSGIDILLTHGPPLGIFDKNLQGEPVGCIDLLDEVQKRIKPRLHVFGHIHEEAGKMQTIDGITFVNCSFVDPKYRPIHKPMRIVL